MQTNLKEDRGEKAEWPSKAGSDFTGLALFLVFESLDKELCDGGKQWSFNCLLADFPRLYPFPSLCLRSPDLAKARSAYAKLVLVS